MVDARLEPFLAAVEARLDGLRADLRARYGWTRIEVEVAVELAPDQLTPLLWLRGHVAAPALAARIEASLRPLLLPGMVLVLELEPLPVQAWYGVPAGGLQLWAQHPRAKVRELATELGPADGPVAHLAHDGPGMLLRARDGTQGWASGLLGAARDPRPLGPPRFVADDRSLDAKEHARLGEAIVAAARSYLGVPYVLGGASREQIDCSALVQRVLVAAADLLVPRNTRDQLALVDGGERCGRAHGPPGDLIYMHSRRMQRMHVGIVSGEHTIIHASRTLGAVVEVELIDFQIDAEWMRRVEPRGLLEWGLTQVGRAFVELPRRSTVGRR